MKVTFLDWDTRHFGFRIGKADWSGDTSSLRELTKAARSAGFVLLYIFAPADAEIDWDIVPRPFAFFQSLRVEFEKSVANCPAISGETSAQVVTLTIQNCSLDSVHELGVLAGSYSRFMCDPNMPRAKAQELYRIWAEDSIRGRLADTVFGSLDASGNAQALVTIKREQMMARIGLLAVTKQQQGKGIATRLLVATEDWANHQALQAIRVITQAENLPACRLYTKHGYREISRQKIFHLWLEAPPK